MPEKLVENLGVKLIPFQNNMPDKESPRSIRFPVKLWKLIDEDAKRCKRSAVKQMEAILSLYYDLSDSEINKTAIKQTKNQNSLEEWRFSPDDEVETKNAEPKIENGVSSKE